MSSHNRKRSLHDTPLDLSKTKLAQQRLRALKEELIIIEETTEEMEQIMTHVDALQVILDTTVVDNQSPHILPCSNKRKLAQSDLRFGPGQANITKK